MSPPPPPALIHYPQQRSPVRPFMHICPSTPCVVQFSERMNILIGSNRGRIERAPRMACSSHSCELARYLAVRYGDRLFR